MSPNLRFYGTTTVRSNYITVKVILLSWLFGRNTCKVVPWRYNKTRINCNGLLNLSNELEKKNSHIFICNGKSWNIKNYFQLFFLTKGYSNTSTGFIGGFTIQILYSDPPRACWCQCTWYKLYFFQCKWPYKRQMNENDDNEKNIKCYHIICMYILVMTLEQNSC
jgi:hypothetical protein